MRRTRSTAAAFALAVVTLGIASPAYAGPESHDHPSPTPAAQGHDHSGHGAAPVTTPAGGSGDDVTRVAVLGGFGAINAAAIGTAYVLRRRDRRTGRLRGPRNLTA